MPLHQYQSQHSACSHEISSVASGSINQTAISRSLLSKKKEIITTAETIQSAWQRYRETRGTDKRREAREGELRREARGRRQDVIWKVKGERENSVFARKQRRCNRRAAAQASSPYQRQLRRVLLRFDLFLAPLSLHRHSLAAHPFSYVCLLLSPRAAYVWCAVFSFSYRGFIYKFSWVEIFPRRSDGRKCKRCDCLRSVCFGEFEAIIRDRKLGMGFRVVWQWIFVVLMNIINTFLGQSVQ